MKSQSSNPALGIADRLRELIWLLRKYIRRSRERNTAVLFGQYDKALAEYADYYARYSDIPLASARIVEIGFGTRPLRLATLRAHGLNAVGVDMDRPLLRLRIADVRQIIRTNGLERALKSVVRYAISDRKEWSRFRAHHLIEDGRPLIDPAALHVANAADPEFWKLVAPADLIVSEDVFEHIDLPDLERLLATMAGCLSPGGLAMIRPNIFTGITGGHRMEWYGFNLDQDIRRRSRPWAHLRGDDAPAGTALNRLTRAEYRALFSKWFHILEERVDAPDLGRRWLTGETAEDLKHWPEEELFSNTVMFVLRPRTSDLTPGDRTP